MNCSVQSYCSSRGWSTVQLDTEQEFDDFRSSAIGFGETWLGLVRNSSCLTEYSWVASGVCLSEEVNSVAWGDGRFREGECVSVGEWYMPYIHGRYDEPMEQGIEIALASEPSAA